MEQALEDLQPIIQEYGLTRKSQTKEKRKMTTLFLVYRDEHQAALDRLMDEFSSEAVEHGVGLKVVDTGQGMA